MTKEEQIALYNNANVSKNDLIEEINRHINKYKWFRPINNYCGINSKIRKFCSKNNLQTLETHLFANKIPTKLKGVNYYLGEPSNDIYVVVDSNKIKHICCIRSGGLPTLLDVNTKITLPTIKLIYKTFVLDGIDVRDYIKFIKKTKIDVVNFSEKYKDKLIINLVNNNQIQLKKLKKITFSPKKIELVLDYEYYYFFNDTGKLQRTFSYRYDSASGYDSITKYFIAHFDDKLISKDMLIESALRCHESKIKKLETELQQTLETIESHYSMLTV